MLHNKTKLGKHIHLLDDHKSTPDSNHVIRTLKNYFKVKFLAKVNIVIRMRESNFEKIQPELTSLLHEGFEILRGDQRSSIEVVYVGNSKSGLKEKSFWVMDKYSRDRIGFEEILNIIGDFSHIKYIEKFAKCYSLAFSNSQYSGLMIDPSEFRVLDDVKTQDGFYEFTDGIGLMRKSLARDISKNMKLQHERFIFQFRCGGFKGLIVAFDDQIFDRVLQSADKRVKIIFRHSQQKFRYFKSEPISLNILSADKYSYSSSSLKSQFIMVLDGLATNSGFKQWIVDKYQQSFKELDECLVNPTKAMEIFQHKKKTASSIKYQNSIKICKSDIRAELDPNTFRMIKHKLMDEFLGSKILKQKLSIPIEESRCLIGISDETQSLSKNEVFVSYRDLSGKINYLNNIDVLVVRAPCYGLSEIQKVRAKYVPGLEHLADCVAFSQKGRRPLTDKLGGGDLDGDAYFVFWDANLTGFVKNNHNSVIKYPKSNPQQQIKISKNDDLQFQLANNFVHKCLKNDNAGLFNRNLICIYESENGRAKMTSQEYVKNILNINQAFDGVYISDANFSTLESPIWQLPSRELRKLANSRDIKFDKQLCVKMDTIYELLKKKQLKINEHKKTTKRKSFSIIAELMLMTYDKFIQLYEDKNSN